MPPNLAEDYEKFVPFTARMMAAMRAIESQREDRLFNDPFAATLAGEAAFHEVKLRLDEEDQAYVATRTRFFDDFLLRSQASQVVLLASGLDTRAYRLMWRPSTIVYELDFPEVLSYKNTLLQQETSRCQHHLIAADLTQAWQEKLLAAGYSPEVPSVWLIEGLVMYLSEAHVHALLQTVSNLSTVGSQLGLDLVNTQSLNYGAYQGYFQFGCDVPENLLSPFGWKAKVVQPGDTEAHFGRIFKPFPPRDIPNVMRAFLICAQKELSSFNDDLF